MPKDYVTHEEIDRAGLLDSAIKAFEDELSMLKEKIKGEMGPSEMLEGNEYTALTSKAPESKPRASVDYRAELIAAKGVKYVEKLEEDAVEKASKKKSTYGEPKLSFRANFDLKSLATTGKRH